MKRKFLIVSLFVLFMTTGCGNIPELYYEGEEFVYTCSSEDVKLFDGNLDVLTLKNQGFVLIYKDSKWDEIINEKENLKLKFRKNDSNRKEISFCYFINYDKTKNNSFEITEGIQFKDNKEGNINVSIKGNYSFSVIDFEKFIAYYSMEDYEDFNKSEKDINDVIKSSILDVYITNSKEKTYTELIKEKEFSEEELEQINSILSNYGIEVIEVNIEEVSK